MDEIVKKAEELGYDSLALTDRDVMTGVPDFLSACRRHHIRPLIGLEAVCRYEADDVPFVLLARDRKGYEDLMQLSSTVLSQEEYNPLGQTHCTAEQLKEASAHCYLIARSIGGAAYSALESQDRTSLHEIYARMKDFFGSFIIGISGCEQKKWRQACNVLEEVAEDLGIPCAAMPLVMYTDREDADLYRLVNAIAQSARVDDPFLETEEACWLMNQKELAACYTEKERKTAEQIAEGCRIAFDEPSVSLPVYYHDDAGHTSADYLKALCRKGLERRLQQNHIPQNSQGVYRNRLKEELQVILQMHFEDYFLIVFDYVRYAKRHDIWTGPGRGSAVASLTAYSIGITDIDPVRYHLLFARFLNTGRKGMPDIDVDFAERDRKKVIAYVQEKYGKECTAGVVAVSCYKTKNLLSAVSKAMGIYESPACQRLYRRVSDLLKKRENSAMSLQELRPMVKEYLNDPSVEKCYRSCERLAGIPAQYGRHPSGIVVADRPIVRGEPVMKLQSEGLMYFGQYEEKDLEERGLIKMDFLSLPSARPLEEMIRKVKEKDPRFDIHQINMDEPVLYATFSHGFTAGYFQFDAWSMRHNILPVIQPENFNDLVVCNAIGRANLTGLVQQYSDLKAHPEKAVYYSDELREVLGETYGIMLYQEQVILTAHAAAGYSMAEADALRRGIKKKDRRALAAQKNDFISRCTHHQPHSYTPAQAQNLWQSILKFADYGFNKSHSVAYTTIAVWQAYMKVHYTDLYYACMVNCGKMRMDEAEKEKENLNRFLNR